jgi:protein-S-isoprenylcysteine O-methyltransferase Ste14
MLGQRLMPRMPVIEMVSAVICLSGVALAIWARRTLARNWSGGVTISSQHTLIQKGPYALVRHPIYLGLLIAQVGMMATLGEVRGLVLLIGAERLMKKAAQEDLILRVAYPMEYHEYERRVKRLLPWIW